jgi:hypothetical protein
LCHEVRACKKSIGEKHFSPFLLKKLPELYKYSTKIIEKELISIAPSTQEKSLHIRPAVCAELILMQFSQIGMQFQSITRGHDQFYQTKKAHCDFNFTPAPSHTISIHFILYLFIPRREQKRDTTARLTNNKHSPIVNCWQTSK